jgi:competence protein ComEA
VTEITRAQFAVAAVVVALAAWLGGRALAPASGGGAAVSGLADGGGEPASAAGGEPGAGGEGAEPNAGAGAAVAIERPPATKVVVHVAGAVRRPGVYRLEEGERIADAVKRAGGRAPGADLDAINLAAKVKDGVQILVPRRVAGGRAGGGAAPAAGGGIAPAGVGVGTAGAAGAAPPVIDLNSATAEQLDTLDGVGPATAAKILQYRAEHGPFRSVDDLDQIPGIGPKRLAAIRPRVRV